MAMFVGTSGWQYDDWKPVLYPDIPKAKWLEHFATQFSTVEVNNTFYRLPEEATFAAWRARTPDDFVFAIKASRFITHIRRLRDVSEAVTTLIERASALGPKLGAVLYQLPPSFKRDDETLGAFLAMLPPKPRSVMEFRHASWFDDAVLDALAAANVALCVTDEEKIHHPAAWSYFRLHGGPDYTLYDPDQAALWAARVADAAKQRDPVFVYFDNDSGGAAVIDARRMRENLAMLSPDGQGLESDRRRLATVDPDDRGPRSGPQARGRGADLQGRLADPGDGGKRQQALHLE